MYPLPEHTLFQNVFHQLLVVHTDLVESESLIQQIAAVEAQRCPQNFAGKTPCVYFKLAYVSPFEPFESLRQLILQIYENTGLRAQFKGIVAIEATEWVGHETENYFTILLKFLYDHREIWTTAIVVNNINPSHLQRFLSVCAGYNTPHLIDATVFSHTDRLTGFLRHAFQEKGAILCQEAEKTLITALQSEELKHARSLALIERTAEEIMQFPDALPILSAATIQDYLSSPYTALTMMAGKLFSTPNQGRKHDETIRL